MNKQKQNQRKLNLSASPYWIAGLLFLSLSTHLSASVSDGEQGVKISKVIPVQNTISGKIVSASDNMGIPGVNVILKGSKIGTTTDIDGNYTLNIPNNSGVLVISYIGYLTQEVKVGNSKTINVSLKNDISTLQEVVVVGFGTAKKETLTGSVEKIKSDVFEDRAVTNVALALQGQTPGLVVNRTSSRPGNEGINLQIRGVTSINGGSPLIVIDGAPAFDDSEFYQMNPDDIESISVLKDGAASIYGSRAANGVILVTTKKGKGKMKVEYNSSFRYNTLGLRPPVPTYQQYGQLWLDAAKQDTVPNYWNWGEATVKAFAAGESGFFQTPTLSWGYNGLIYMAPADRYTELFGANEGHQHSLSISGSSDQARYRLSFGQSESEGALKTAYDGIKQYSVRLNTDFDLTEKLTLGSNISLQKNITSSPSTSFGQNLAVQDPPVFPSKNPQGQWYANFGNAGGNNSIAGTTAGGRDKLAESIAKITLNLKYDLGHGFSANAAATYNQVSSREDITALNVLLYNWNGEKANNSINTTSSIQTLYITKTYQTYGSFLNYDKSLGNHNFKAMLGMTAEKSDYQGLWAQKTGLVDQGVYDINVATGTTTAGGTGTSHDRGQDHEGLYSYLTRINYDYQEKYLLEVVGRRDGSSRFAPGFKFNNYGSASIGWNIHKENFMKNFEALSNLKVRASIGSSGNQEGIGAYDYVSTIGTGTKLFGQSGTLSPTSYIDGLTTTTRSWENVEMKNIGVDFALFKNKLSGTFETYERKNNGMLIGVTYPEVLGATPPKTNSGNLETKGWEAMLNWKDTKGNVSYNIGINMSNSNNILVNLEGGSSIVAGLRSTVQGYPLNSYFVWQTDGLFQTQAEVDAYKALYVKTGSLVPTGASAIRIGDTKKVDLDGNGLINDQNASNPKGQGDVKFAGDAQAHYVFGINLGAKYKGFDFTTFFQGALKQVVFRSDVNAFPFNVPWANQTIAYNDKTWTPEYTDASYPRLTAQNNLAKWNWTNTDILQQNNRYIRLKTIVIGYSLPSEVIKRLKVDKLRIYVSGNDLFELSTLVDGFDPEAGNVSSTSSSSTDQKSIYPFQRTFAFGVNLAF